MTAYEGSAACERDDCAKFRLRTTVPGATVACCVPGCGILVFVEKVDDKGDEVG